MRGIPKRVIPRHASPRPSVCPSCSRLQLRHSQPLQQPQHQQSRRFVNLAPPKPPSAGLAALTSRQLLSVTGPDATKFLHGIVTANITGPDGLPRTDAFYSGFLNATGRVVHDLFIYPFRGQALSALSTQYHPDEDGYLIEADAREMARFAKLINRYKLRAKVIVRALSQDEASVWQAWDDSPAGFSDIIPSESRIILRDPRAPGMGHRIVQIGSRAPEIDFETSTQDAYTIRRYLHGVPEGQDEILREQALPLESNIDMMNGIDFRKGCYVGQELTIRTKHRGVVRKRILPCSIYDADKAPPQTLLYEPNCAGPETLTADMIPGETSIGRYGKRGRSAGKWLKGVGNVGLALCRLEIMTDVALPGEQAAATYKPEDEFVMEWGEEENKSSIKVKAFVPEWLRSGLAA
ncbi:hypothetical protein E4U09_001617 [Claviceps aff. purpurea]|uniref:Iron-sulfur cluster assembly factor IBA57 homolog, mitochondrial n=1 Tax=Claviceps aff. purpurea TaxID=1967640 RepID=A0A9P7TZA1_9HYPO|nr:hypothetical protein E4U09_001617 [Claviceps aff. purpurea]